MGQLLRSLTVIAVLVAGVTPLAAFDAPKQSAGGSKKGPVKEGGGAAKAGAANEDDTAASTAQRRLDAGISAYEADKINQAIRAFNTVISGGAVNSQQMARALYYRGLANRKKGRTALAIADLSAAAWLKDGLTFSEQQKALANRAEAYQEAGVADVPPTAPSTDGAFGAEPWQTALSPQAAAAPQTASATYVPPRPPPPPPQSSSSGGGGFFDSITNMFGGGSSQSEVTTASVHEGPATSAWSQTTEIVTPSPPQAAPQTAAAAPPPLPTRRAAAVRGSAVTKAVARPKKKAAASGKYHVQVAAVRSRDEANAVSVRLLSQHASELGSRRPEVEQKVMGGMGVFYRVSVGPYASAAESKRICGSLRASGFDCLITIE